MMLLNFVGAELAQPGECRSDTATVSVWLAGLCRVIATQPTVMTSVIGSCWRLCWTLGYLLTTTQCSGLAAVATMLYVLGTAGADLTPLLDNCRIETGAWLGWTAKWIGLVATWHHTFANTDHDAVPNDVHCQLKPKSTHESQLKDRQSAPPLPVRLRRVGTWLAARHKALNPELGADDATLVDAFAQLEEHRTDGPLDLALDTWAEVGKQDSAVL